MREIYEPQKRVTTERTVLDGEKEIQEKAETLDRFANQFDQLVNNRRG